MSLSSTGGNYFLYKGSLNTSISEVDSSFCRVSLRTFGWVMTNKTVLIYDDDPKICRLLHRALKVHGLEGKIVCNLDELFTLVLQPDVGLLILDLTLPEKDGLKIAKELKSQCNLPIMMVTGRADVVDKVKGFDSGADDYLSKPFAIEELIVRARRLLDTYSRISHREILSENEIELTNGIVLDVRNKKLKCENVKNQILTNMELKILVYLLEHRGDTVSRELLGRNLIGVHWSPNDRGIDVHVARIRKKINEFHPANNVIESVRGKGYLINSF